MTSPLVNLSGRMRLKSLPASAALLVLVVASLVAPSSVRAQWVTFQDQTSTRLSAAAAVGSADLEEKDYAWGDVDNDGDIDLVAVRKQPFTTTGHKVNVLFLNENGVLTDRTALYATASSVGGDLGFNTPTNDRDVVLVDVDGDGWLDIVTATTLSDTDPKYIGYPRIYHNLKRDTGNNWLGFRYEESWIPAMLSYPGNSGFNPRFCSVAAGDLTGDGKPELWFGDYDATGVGGSNPENPLADFNDKLLVNNGSGQFTDGTATHFSGNVPSPINTPFMVSAFGAAEVIADMNGDGLKDIVKQTSLNPPTYVGLAQNKSAGQGSFIDFSVLYQQSPYFVSAGELNNDGKMDLVITDDGADSYLLNLGNNGPNGMPTFLGKTFTYDAAGSDGFGSQSLVVDLDNDGWNDVLISDVDVDSPGCARRLHIYRNLGGIPGSAVTLQEQTTGTNCQTSAGNPPSCLVASIPSDKLEGVFNVAAFDINGDGYKDLVLGRCTGTSVYMNIPPVGLKFTYPIGLPFFVTPSASFTFKVQVTGLNGAVPQPNTGKMFFSIAGGPFTQVSMTDLGGNLYQVSLPPAACTQSIRFYVTADMVAGGTFVDPAGAPATTTYKAVAATGTTVSLYDGMEGPIIGWQVVNDPSLTAGVWEVAAPNGTITGGGVQAAPATDAESATNATKAFVTLNGPVGGAVGTYDVDGGPTDLLSPVINLAGTDANISYFRWAYSSGVDTFQVSVSNNNGASWVTAETISATGSNAWLPSSFKVGDFVTPTSQVRVRFRANDVLPASTVEAGLDAFTVEQFTCTVSGAASGRIPDGIVPGTPLAVTTALGGQVTLTWGASCTLGDNDYEVYEGTIGNFTSYLPRQCSTGGLTTATFTPASLSAFYLIVPTNGANEGSYGVAGGGVQRAVSGGACHPQNAAACQ